jgi:hypothetical protein
MGRGFGMVVIAFALVGCGGSKKGSGSRNDREPAWECSFSITLSGEITSTIDTDDRSSCSVTHSLGSGISWDIDANEDAPYLAIDVEDVTEGELGDFPASLSIYSQDLQQRFVAPDCSVTLTEHELVETEQTEEGVIRTYRVAGSGACPGGAIDANGSAEPLTVSDFPFRLMSIWQIQ